MGGLHAAALVLLSCLAGCDSKAFDPTETIAEYRTPGSGLNPPLYTALKEGCLSEKQQGIEDGKHCYALKITNETMMSEAHDRKIAALEEAHLKRQQEASQGSEK